MHKPRMFAAAAATVALVAAPLMAGPAMADAPKGTQLQLLNITDFHGRIDEAGQGVASAIEKQRAQAADDDVASIALSTGDNIGASTYASSSQQDAPTIDVLNAMGIKASAVGNHEFDKGYDDLTDRVMKRADFPYLGANVYKKGTKDLAPGMEAYKVVDVPNPAGGDDIKVGVVGAVTSDTESLVSPGGISDIEFGDVTEGVNKAVKEMESQDKPDVTVVEAHTGPADTSGSLDDAKASNAEFKKLINDADASVDAFFVGHTHLPADYNTKNRPVIEAAKYGEKVGEAVLESQGGGDWTIKSHQLIDTSDADGNQLDYDSDVVDDVKKIVKDAEAKAKEIGSEVAGTISDDITRAFNKGSEDRGSESTLGNLVADALNEGTDGSPIEKSDFGITNSGGLRTDLKVDDIFNKEKKGEVTVAELNQVLPFANDHGVVSMKGSDVKNLFDEQWQPDGASRPMPHLGVSKQLHVVYDSDAARGSHVKQVLVNGKPIKDDKTYRVATLSFLATGGDNFTSFAKGNWQQSGLTDFDVWQTYFETRAEKNQTIKPDKHERQADDALNVVKNGDLKVSLASPSSTDSGAVTVVPGGTTKLALKLNAKKALDGPFVLDADLPAGLKLAKATAGQSDDAKGTSGFTATAAGDDSVKVTDVPKGESTVNLTLTAADSAKAATHTVTTGFAADPDHAWWDDNPLPLPATAKVKVTVTGDDAPQPTPTNGEGDDNGSGGADNGSGGDDSGGSDGHNGDNGGSGGDNGDNSDDPDAGGDMPRTGAEIGGLVAGALALLAVGAVTMMVGRRRRSQH